MRVRQLQLKRKNLISRGIISFEYNKSQHLGADFYYIQLYLSPKALFVIIHGKVSFLMLIHVIVLIYMASIKFGLVPPPRKNKNFVKSL